jgi:hypothetical protein
MPALSPRWTSSAASPVGTRLAARPARISREPLLVSCESPHIGGYFRHRRNIRIVDPYLQWIDKGEMVPAFPCIITIALKEFFFRLGHSACLPQKIEAQLLGQPFG